MYSLRAFYVEGFQFKDCMNIAVFLCKRSTLCQSEDVIMYFPNISPDGSCYYNDKYDRNGINVMYQHLEVITADYPVHMCLVT